MQAHQTVGIMHGRRFLDLSEGGRFVTYVTKKALLDGHGEPAGSPFSGDEPILGPDQSYPYRRRVRLGETGLGA